MRLFIWAIIVIGISWVHPPMVFADGDPAAGREAYMVYGCAVCHGKEGHGDGISGKGMYPPPTNLYDTSTYTRGYDKDSIRHSIKHGIKSERSTMPPFPHIAGRELEDLVAYVTSLQTPTAVPSSSHKDAAPELTGAWIKAMPPSQTATAAYVYIHNPSTTPIILSSASSPVAGVTEIHRMERKGGKMTMGLAGPVSIAPGGTVSLVPGGYHIMLIQLKHVLNAGDKVPITFKFQDGKEITVNADVRAE